MKKWSRDLRALCAALALLACLTGTAAAADMVAEDGNHCFAEKQEPSEGLLALQATETEGVETVIDGVRYSLSDGTATVVGYTKDIPAQCTIPGSVTMEGAAYTVTAIGEGGLLNCSQLRSIVLPDTLQSIGGNAFSGCTGLTDVTIPAGVTAMGGTGGTYAPVFRDCTALTSIAVEAGNSAYKAVDGVLYSADGTVLYEYPIGKTAASYTVQPGTQRISNEAFYCANHLTSVTFPDSVVYLGNSAFEGCASLETIDLGDGLQIVGSDAFMDCGQLRRLAFPATLRELQGNNYNGTSETFQEFVVATGCEGYETVDGVLFQKSESGTILWGYPAGKAGAYQVPGDVTEIADEAFWDAVKLTELTFAEDSSLTTIGDGAFTGCSALTSLTVPDTVTSIGSYAFQTCHNLTQVHLSANLRLLQEGTFYQCSSLRTIQIPVATTEVWDTAFENCDGLESFTVADGNTVFSVVDGVLYGKLNDDGSRKLVAFPAAKAATSITIPADVTEIAAGTFSSVSELTAIEVEEGNPVFFAQDGVLFQRDGATTILHTYPCGKPGASYTVPEGVTVIGSNAFFNNTALTQVDASEVTSIGSGAFQSAKGLESIRLEQVRVLGQNAFIFSGLRSITLPETLTTFGSQILDFCYDLEYIEFLGQAPEYEKNTVYSAGICYGAHGLRYVYVPQGTQQQYLTLFGQHRIAPGAMVVEGRYVPEADVSDMIAQLPELPAGTEVTEEEKTAINAAATAVVRLSSEDAGKLSDGELLKVADLFQQANTGVTVATDTEAVETTQVTVQGAALASGLVEKEHVAGAVEVRVTEVAPAASSELLNLDFGMTVDGEDKQLQSPVVVTVQATEEMLAAERAGDLQLVHRDGTAEETVDYTLSGDQITFRAASFSSYVFLDDSKVGTTLVVTYDAGAGAENLYVAGYDSHGRMVSLASFAVSGSGTQSMERPEGETFRAILADDSLRPAGTAQITIR